MPESTRVAGKAESLQYSASASDINCAAILPFDRVSPDQYPSFVRENDATLSFPEKLMMMLMHIEHTCISSGRNPQDEAIHWTRSGDAFVVRDEKRLSAVWLRIFFGTTMYSSFTRKMYRWSFHKISPAVYQYDRGEVTIFGSINFHRDKKHLLLQMESQTAAKQRRSLMAQQRKLKFQQVTKDKAAEAYEQKVSQNDQPSTPLVDECLGQMALSRSNVHSLPLQGSAHEDSRAAMLDRLQKGMFLASLLREGGCNGSVSSWHHLNEHDMVHNRLGSVSQASQSFVQNQPSLAMHLLEERVQQQKAHYEHIQMLALAAIMRNQSALE